MAKCSCPEIIKIPKNILSFFIDQCKIRLLSLDSCQFACLDENSSSSVGDSSLHYTESYLPASSDEDEFNTESNDENK